jgi:hypothetical protein
MPENRKDIIETRSGAVPVSRRSFLGKTVLGAAAAAGAALTATTGPASAKDKISQAEAHYQNHPNKGQHCGGCTHYFFGSCAIVAGSISSNGWCKFFKAAA